jgi:hypothetical protein
MNTRIAFAYLSPILIASLVGCQQSGRTPEREGPFPFAPAPEWEAKGEGAKPIRILSGQLIYDRATGAFPIEMKGTQGLRLEVVVRDGFFVPRLDCAPCEPGSQIGLDGMFIDTGLTGSVRLQGKTYQLGEDPCLTPEWKSSSQVTVS